MNDGRLGHRRLRPEVQSQPRTLEAKRMKRKYQGGREQKRKGRREGVRREKAILKTTVGLLSGCSKASMTLVAFKERSFSSVYVPEPFLLSPLVVFHASAYVSSLYFLTTSNSGMEFIFLQIQSPAGTLP